jgi:NurA-like 5'-3' nuclease
MKKNEKMSNETPEEILVRKLYYIPIIHTHVDMGSLNKSIIRATLHNLGRTALKRKIDLIDKMWNNIEQTIQSLYLSYKSVLLYQDGLPVCGQEVKIVTQLAKAGSRNHQLLLNMMGKGATIMGTESLELLMEEYELAKQVLADENILKFPSERTSQQALSDSLLKKRDQFIANRINSTFHRGKTGILFLGMLHSVVNWLDNDILVVKPFNRNV